MLPIAALTHIMEKILSLNELKRNVGSPSEIVKSTRWHTSTIFIKYMLPLKEYIDIVHKIITYCTNSDGNIAIELLDFSTRINIISSYVFVELPEDIDELFNIAYNSGLYEIACSVANEAQIKSIIDTVMMVVSPGVI